METVGFALIALAPIALGLLRAYRQRDELGSPNDLRDWLYDEKAARR